MDNTRKAFILLSAAITMGAAALRARKPSPAPRLQVAGSRPSASRPASR